MELWEKHYFYLLCEGAITGGYQTAALTWSKIETVCRTQSRWKEKADIPVIDAPVEAEVEGAEVAALPHHLHHRLIVELRNVPQVQDGQVAELKTR